MLRLAKDSSDHTSAQRLPMSSMIDVVFLLLVFFVMTFKITSQEADFAMERAATSGVSDAVVASNIPLQLKLDATPDGNLAAMQLNGERIASLDDLHLRLMGLAGDGALVGVAMTLDCDARLKYQHVIEVLDHVTAYHDELGRRQLLVSSTRFAIRR